MYYNYERYEKAAQIYEKKGFYKKSAYIYEKGGNLKKAAVNFEKWFMTSSDTSVGYSKTRQLEQDLLKAVDLYSQLNELEKAYDLLIKYGKFEKAGGAGDPDGQLARGRPRTTKRPSSLSKRRKCTNK